MTFQLPLYRGDPHPCSYLPGRTAQSVYAFPQRLAGVSYEQLMNDGFRRSGRLVYRPTCQGCRECVPIRVPVAEFRPSRSQRKAWNRNQDVELELGEPECTDEKWEVYVAYLRQQHDKQMSGEREEFENFLYTTCTDTIEMVYRVEGRFVGAGILDVAPQCLSSVYFYFDPTEARRSLGVFSALCEIEACRRLNLPWWYIGFFIRDCEQMNYKANYRPYELLRNGKWQRAGE